MNNWNELEEFCVHNQANFPDCIPRNIREWDQFIKQYEHIVEFVNSKKDPSYIGIQHNDEVDVLMLNELLLGLGYKHSPLEVLRDFIRRAPHQRGFGPYLNELRAQFCEYLDMEPIKKAEEFFNLMRKSLGNYYVVCDWKPKHVIKFDTNGWTSEDGTLKDCPRSAINFDCTNSGITTLKGGPTHVGTVFNCSGNKITSLEGSPFMGVVDGQTMKAGSIAAGSNKISRVNANDVRGDISYLDLAFNEIEFLDDFPKCRILDLSDNQVKSINQVKKLYKKVDRVHLSNNPIHDFLFRHYNNTILSNDDLKACNENIQINKGMKKFKDFLSKVNESKNRTRIHSMGEFLNEAHDFPTMTYFRASQSRTTDFIAVGTCPHDEDCPQANPEDSNVDEMSRQCVAYINQLVREHGKAPGNAYWFIMRNDHEVGQYLEAALMYNPDRDDETDYAFSVESGADNWDEEATKELENHDMSKKTDEGPTGDENYDSLYKSIGKYMDDMDESWRPKDPIIGDAMKMLVQAPGVVKVHSKDEYDKTIDAQKYFSASHSHCFRDKEEEDHFHKHGSKYLHKSSADSDILYNTGSLVATWDAENGVGYVLPKGKGANEN